MNGYSHEPAEVFDADCPNEMSKMKQICTVNTTLPTVNDRIAYLSDSSLLDYDIVVFDPSFPNVSRIEFTGGGSCVTIDSSQRLAKAMKHWSSEILGAVISGKTVFVLLNSYETDSLASGYTTPRKDTRNYTTTQVNNYDALPILIDSKNATGRRFKVTDSAFKGLFDALKDFSEYKIIIKKGVSKNIFTTLDGENVVGGALSIEGAPGNLILLPHFDFFKVDDDDITMSHRIVSQLVAIDKALRSGIGGTPKPEWINSVPLPTKITNLNEGVEKIDAEILELEHRKDELMKQREELEKYTALLYENGKILESVVAEVLELLGYKVENYRAGDLEIDHIIVGSSGLRMIGESEGKDNTAIDISKFRQLESNINEDFSREEIDKPAKGVLFGNGYRFVAPEKRQNIFTQKCLINAQRLGTALVRTSDLYRVALHILDNPKDKKFRERCREAIEKTAGDIVEFPTPT